MQAAAFAAPLYKDKQFLKVHGNLNKGASGSMKLNYSGIPHLRKWILRKRDTVFLKKVSSYKKVFSLKKYHFLIIS